jgi:hypothetical protein
MNQRCYNSLKPDWNNYGGRGITVCDEWRKDFLTFREWALQTGYKAGLMLDRENNNGNYYPDNCRWVRRRTQQNNRRYTFNLTIDGETKPLTEWIDDVRCTASYNTVYSRLIRNGWSPKKAVFQPSRGLS